MLQENCGRNGIRGLEGPFFHDVSCTLVLCRDRTRNSDITTDQDDTVMYPPSDPRYKFDEFVPGIRKGTNLYPPL